MLMYVMLSLTMTVSCFSCFLIPALSAANTSMEEAQSRETDKDCLVVCYEPAFSHNLQHHCDDGTWTTMKDRSWPGLSLHIHTPFWLAPEGRIKIVEAYVGEVRSKR